MLKIRLVGAEMFHADRQTDRKLIVASRSFANTPKTRLKEICGTVWIGLICCFLSVNFLTKLAPGRLA